VEEIAVGVAEEIDAVEVNWAGETVVEAEEATAETR
jgi:hypothetical protein